MSTLTHKTTLLLSPEEHRRLVREAQKHQTTMGEMIRRAVRKLYFSRPKANNRKTWNKLFQMKAPVGDWKEMEDEILKGRLGS